MKYTDAQLKRELMKMLPDDLYQPKGDTDICWSNASEKCHRDRRGYYVLDSELLYLCHMAEKTLGLPNQATCYLEWLGLCEDDYGFKMFKFVSATWRERVIGLCMVKGVLEIVK